MVWSRFGLVSALAFSLLLSGCTSHPPRYSSMTPAERQMRQQSEFFNDSNVQACVATGIAVGLLALLASDDHRGRNAAIGFAAGCGVGVGVNSYVQSKRREYRNDEQRMQVMINDLRDQNQHLSRLVDTSNEVLDRDRQRIAGIERAYRERRISLAEARRHMERVRSNRDHLEDTLESLREKQSDWYRIRDIERRSGVNTAGLDAEIERLRQQVDALERELELMDEQIAASPVPA